MRFTLSLLLPVIIAFVSLDCTASRRTPIEGYSEAELNGRRVALLLPDEQDIAFSDAGRYASIRGVAGASAGETALGELRTMLPAAIGSLLDSNAILVYGDLPVSGVVPLNARDFSGGGPRNWDDLQKAGREGNLDYLIVLSDVRYTNPAVADPVGDESVTAKYGLFDLANRRVMTTGPVTVSIKPPRTPATTYETLARELTMRLPFFVYE